MLSWTAWDSCASCGDGLRPSAAVGGDRGGRRLRHTGRNRLPCELEHEIEPPQLDVGILLLRGTGEKIGPRQRRLVRPGGALYLYPEAPGGSGKAFAERAVVEEKMLVVPGAVFGAADTHFRIAYTVSDAVLDRGIAALRRLAETA